MELAFKPAEEAGWRGRGAPRKHVPDNILQVLQHARDTGEVGIVTVQDETEDEIKDLQRVLVAGDRHIGRRVRVQYDRAESVVRFRVGEKL